ncbi:MAG: XkdX family protein [Schleiferilactobacillus harbinensis]|jgi:hypothetical protein|nr:XkdX family protein [Schleiferilactobacillus harbinensis]
MLEFVKLMYSWGCPIEGYVTAGAITAEQYQEITDKNTKCRKGDDVIE